MPERIVWGRATSSNVMKVLWGLEELGLAGWISDVFYGAALVVAVTLTTLLRKRAPT